MITEVTIFITFNFESQQDAESSLLVNQSKQPKNKSNKKTVETKGRPPSKLELSRTKGRWSARMKDAEDRAKRKKDEDRVKKKLNFRETFGTDDSDDSDDSEKSEKSEKSESECESEEEDGVNEVADEGVNEVADEGAKEVAGGGAKEVAENESNVEDVKLSTEPIHFPKMDVFEDASAKKSIPLDFFYKKEKKPDSDEEWLKYKPTESKTRQEERNNKSGRVIHIKRTDSSFNRKDFMSRSFVTFDEKKSPINAKELHEEMIRNPDAFRMADLPPSDKKKINAKIGKYKNVVDPDFRFFEIIRHTNDLEECPFTGEYARFRSFLKLIFIFDHSSK